MQTSKDSISTDNSAKIYAGNPWLSSCTLSLLFTVFFLAFVLIKQQPNGFIPYVFSFVVLIGFYLSFTLQMNYFIVDEKSLIIKNHYAPWDFTTVPFDTIHELKLERPYKLATSLCIVNTDLKSTIYGADSLSKQNWHTMMGNMESKGLKVIDYAVAL
jgi:hypothetical protein